MLGECQAPGVLDGLDHVPLNGVRGKALSYGWPYSRR
jgi:hypothetical protein